MNISGLSMAALDSAVAATEPAISSFSPTPQPVRHRATLKTKYTENTLGKNEPVWTHAPVVLCRGGGRQPLGAFAVVVRASVLVKSCWVANVQLEQIFHLIGRKLLALLRRQWCRSGGRRNKPSSVVGNFVPHFMSDKIWRRII